EAGAFDRQFTQGAQAREGLERVAGGAADHQSVEGSIRSRGEDPGDAGERAWTDKHEPTQERGAREPEQGLEGRNVGPGDHDLDRKATLPGDLEPSVGERSEPASVLAIEQLAGLVLEQRAFEGSLADLGPLLESDQLTVTVAGLGEQVTEHGPRVLIARIAAQRRLELSPGHRGRI